MSSLGSGLPVSCVSSSALDALVSSLDGVTTYVVDGSTTRDKSSFITVMCDALALTSGRPSADGAGNWDAFADGLWSAFSPTAIDEAAIVWTHAETLLESSLQTFLTAVMTLTGFAASVSSTETGFSHPMTLRLYLVGDGRGWPPGSQT